MPLIIYRRRPPVAVNALIGDGDDIIAGVGGQEIGSEIGGASCIVWGAYCRIIYQRGKVTAIAGRETPTGRTDTRSSVEARSRSVIAGVGLPAHGGAPVVEIPVECGVVCRRDGI